MKGTSGLLGFDSSPSADLQRSLESRLAALLDVNGSPEYELTWSRSAMPSGPPICRLRALGRRTSDNGYSGWPTAKRDDGVSIRSPEGALKEAERKGANDLNTAAVLAGWATPQSRDGEHGKGTPERITNGIRRNLDDMAQLAGWPTPDACAFQAKDLERLRARRQECKERTGNGNGFGLTLGQAAPLLTASTEKHGALNPEFVRWLMGYPEEWGSCGATAMQSSPKSPQRS